MKGSDPSKTFIVRKFGPHGARLYGIILFAWFYAMLIYFTARLWIHAQDFLAMGTWRQTFFWLVIAVLVVIAASLLTHMRIKYFAEIDKLESGQ
jgi:hypothetical protein